METFPLETNKTWVNYLFGEWSCVDVLHFVPQEHKILLMALSLVSTGAHVQYSNMHRTKTQLNLPHGGNNKNTVLYIYIYIYIYMGEKKQINYKFIPTSLFNGRPLIRGFNENKLYHRLYTI